MSDTTDRSSEGSALRPFVEPDQDPPLAEDPIPPPVAEPDEPWAPEPAPGPDAEPMTDGPRPREHPAADAPLPAAAAPVVTATSELPPPDPDVVAQALGAGDEPRGSVAPNPGRDPGLDSQTVTVARTPFLVGLGVLVAAILILAVLWQSAGGDDPASTPAVDVPAPVNSDGVAIDTSDTDALTAALAEQTERADGAERRANDLESQVSDLDDLLASQPIPALPGTALERVIVSADARFVSATDVGVAVVGPFGGYANIDPATNTVTASGQISSEATRVLRTPSTVWATNFAGNELVRLDPVTNEVIGSIAFPGPDGLVKDGDNLLVASFTEGFVARVYPNDGIIVQQVDVGGSATAVVRLESSIYAAVFETGEVVRIDAASFEVVDRVIVGAGPIGLLPVDTDRVWVSNRNEGTVALVDFATGEVSSIPVGEGPVEVAFAFGSVWVAVVDAGELVQIDPDAGAVITRTPLGGSPTGLSVGSGSLWVAVGGDRSVVRVTL